MLGEKIGEFKGKTTTQRVLPTESGSPQVEVSFQSTGKILGVEVSEIGTYQSTFRAGGVLYGEGQGVYMTPDGETCTWRGAGLGRPTGRGSAVNYRGAIYYQTTSPKFSKLNSICAIFEYEVDENGNTHAILSEWK